MKKVSNKMAIQKRKEAKLIKELLEEQEGLCAKCNRWPDFRGLSKHERIHRSQGGDPLDKDNCEMLCGNCHSKEHYGGE